MDKILSYTLRAEDLEDTAGGLVNLILRNRIGVSGHEISRAKFLPSGITVDGIPVTVKERILPGQTLRVVLPERSTDGEMLRVPPTPAPPGMLDFLYEDEDLVVLNKPPGAVVHPTHGHWTDTIGNYLADYYLHCAGGEVTGDTGGSCTVCHVTGRLDKDTSGALVFARNRAAAARLNRERQEGKFIRRYIALVHGCFREEEKTGTVDRPIERVPGVLLKRRVAAPGEGERAVTHYRVLQDTAEISGTGKPDPLQSSDTGLPGVSLVQFRIDTGRTHQIRVHMAYLGHPLLGDPLYGLSGDAAGRAMLHAVQVELRQPFTGEKIVVTAPEAADFAALRTRLGFDVPSEVGGQR